MYPNDQRKSVYRHSWLSVIRVSAYQYNFRNENNVSVLIDPVRNHLTVGTRACQSDFARQYRIRHPNKTQKKNVYRPSEDEFEFVDQSSLFIMEMVFRSLYTQQEIISLQKRVPCFRPMSPSHLLISDLVSKENPEEKCEKPLLGWATSEWPVIKCVMTPNGGEAIRQSKMSSKKVVNCWHSW